MMAVVLHSDCAQTVVMGSARVPAAEVGFVRDAADLLARARAIRDANAREAAEAAAHARAQGHAAGLAEGRAQAEAELGQRLFALETEAAARRLADRNRVAELAVSIVRRIAGELGDGPLIAALAAQAAAELLPGSQAVVLVPPSALSATRARIGSATVVRADPALGPCDCIIETPLGRTLAGLETQLEAVLQLLQPAEHTTQAQHAD